MTLNILPPTLIVDYYMDANSECSESCLLNSHVMLSVVYCYLKGPISKVAAFVILFFINSLIAAVAYIVNFYILVNFVFMRICRTMQVKAADKSNCFALMTTIYNCLEFIQINF